MSKLEDEHFRVHTHHDWQDVCDLSCELKHNDGGGDGVCDCPG